jgi:hypothetical protein
MSVHAFLRFNDWKYVSGLCRQAGRQLLKLELEDRLPSALPTQFA